MQSSIFLFGTKSVKTPFLPARKPSERDGWRARVQPITTKILVAVDTRHSTLLFFELESVRVTNRHDGYSASESGAGNGCCCSTVYHALHYKPLRTNLDTVFFPRRWNMCTTPHDASTESYRRELSKTTICVVCAPLPPPPAPHLLGL